LVVGVNNNLVPRQTGKQAKMGLEQLIDLVGEEVGIPTRVEVLPSERRRDLQGTAVALRNGRIHIVAMGALEYNWLRMAGIPVEILVVANPGVSDVKYFEQLVVHADRFRHPTDLHNKKLATYEKPWPSVKIFQHRLREKWGANILNQEEPRKSPGAALHAVLHDQADAIIVNQTYLRDYTDLFPNATAKLKAIDRDEFYPLVPVIGNPRTVEALRRGLWEELRDELTEVHKQPRASHFVKDWRVGHFSLPNDKYLKEVDQAAEHFPLSDLPMAYGEIPADVSR
jgi:ABC-type phosphate/phosphonate transport system substrate-binding protein